MHAKLAGQQILEGGHLKRQMTDEQRRRWEGRGRGAELLTAGADVALVAVEEAVPDPDIRARGGVA